MYKKIYRENPSPGPVHIGTAGVQFMLVCHAGF
jgi:hypothetical protein